MTKKKIIVTPCIVNSSLKVSAPTTSRPAARAACGSSSASTPPATKNASVAKKYRSPIRLWSTVVSQPRTPGRSSQIRSSRSTRVALGGRRDDGVTSGSPGRRRRSRRARAPLSGSAGIRSPGLTCCGSAIHAREVRGVVRDRHRGERLRVARCVRSGPTLPRRAACRGSVAAGARLRQKTRPPAPLLRVAGERARFAMFASHARNSAGGSATTVERHVRVLEPAELGALAAVAARLVRLEQRGGSAAGDQVDLPVQLRAPRSCGSRPRSCRPP